MEDALGAWLCVAEDEGFDIPNATPQQNIMHDKNDILSVIKADTVKYRAMMHSRAVRKNVSLPAWLAEAAENAHLNLSQELQNALKQRLNLAL